MKRKSRAEKTSGNSSGRTSRKPVELQEVREQIKNLVGTAAVGMVKNGIAEANQGHYAAMKFLFEMIGLFPVSEATEQVAADEGGLAKVLFERLGVELGPEVTNVSAAKSGSGSDAVE